jgi:hypothetical protein
MPSPRKPYPKFYSCLPAIRATHKHADCAAYKQGEVGSARDELSTIAAEIMIFEKVGGFTYRSPIRACLKSLILRTKEQIATNSSYFCGIFGLCINA